MSIYDHKYNFVVVDDGQKDEGGGRSSYTDDLQEVRDADAVEGQHVAFVDEGYGDSRPAAHDPEVTETIRRTTRTIPREEWAA